MGTASVPQFATIASSPSLNICAIDWQDGCSAYCWLAADGASSSVPGVGDVVFRDCNKAAVVFVVGSTGMASDGDKQIIRVAASSQKETHERLVFAHVHSRGGGRGILHQVQVGQGGGHSRESQIRRCRCG